MKYQTFLETKQMVILPFSDLLKANVTPIDFFIIVIICNTLLDATCRMQLQAS